MKNHAKDEESDDTRRNAEESDDKGEELDMVKALRGVQQLPEDEMTH